MIYIIYQSDIYKIQILSHSSPVFVSSNNMEKERDFCVINDKIEELIKNEIKEDIYSVFIQRSEYNFKYLRGQTFLFTDWQKIIEDLGKIYYKLIDRLDKNLNLITAANYVMDLLNLFKAAKSWVEECQYHVYLHIVYAGENF